MNSLYILSLVKTNAINSVFHIFLVSVTHVLLPVLLIGELFRTRSGDKQVGDLANACGYLILIILIGRWDLLSIHLGSLLQWALILLVLLIFPLSLRMTKKWGCSGQKKSYVWLSGGILLGLSSVAISGRYHLSNHIELAFPLKSGDYYVAQGGSNILLNTHYYHGLQRYALDIVKVDSMGNRAKSLLPVALDEFFVFGEIIYSPCDGVVKSATDFFPDNPLGVLDSEHGAGNHVVINCGSAEVVLAHMQNESVQVNAGNKVKKGQGIGKVGNSGNSTEPHIHIHAIGIPRGKMRQKFPIPMHFDDKYLVRNTIIRRVNLNQHLP